MDVRSDDDETWAYFDRQLKGAIAFAIADTGAACIFTTRPIFAAYGMGPGIWRPSCLGDVVELRKVGTAPDFSGGNTLVIRKGYGDLAEAQFQAHQRAVESRMPIPHWSSVKIPLKDRKRAKKVGQAEKVDAEFDPVSALLQSLTAVTAAYNEKDLKSLKPALETVKSLADTILVKARQQWK